MPSSLRASAVHALLTFVAAFTVRAQVPQQRIVGVWQGVVTVGSMRQRIALVVSRDSAGSLAGLMKAVDQGTQAPATVAVHGDTFSFAIPAQRATYSGIVSPAGDSIRGTLTQTGVSIPLSFGRGGASVPLASRPQDPRPPYPYHTQDVIVPSDDGVRLAGTLTIPDGTGPFPAVVFVTGSGPQDRDETILGHHPFLVIADYFARHGIASLRYDDRGFARSTGNFAKSTSADFANDAEAAVHFLQDAPGIARNHVGIIGHSEGGLIGPMVAARSPDVAFLILMAGPGMPGDSLSLLQLRALAGSSVSPQQLDAMLATNRRLYSAVTAARDSADVVRRLMAVKDSVLAGTSAEQRAAVTKRLDQMIPTLVTPWMRYFLRYDSRTSLRRVHVPVLALAGTLDQQVPADANLRGIDEALNTGRDRDHQVVELPRLNHLFQTATTGAPSEYGAIDETIAPEALELMTRWITQRFAAK